VPRSRRSRTAITTSSLASWLRCIHCSQPLEPLDGLVLGCATGHRFDAHRRGYLNTLDASKGIVGDPRPILEARERFLALGLYTPIADAITALLPPGEPLAIVDSGSGTGYYLQQLLAHSPGRGHTALVTDASVAAVTMSVAATGAPGLVADVWLPSPVRDDRADVILCVFAPRNPAEFARILRPGGMLIVVTPTGQHLRELRAVNQVIGMQHDKLTRLDESLLERFALGSRSTLHFEIELSTAAAADLTGMGPSGHHELAGSWQGGSATVSVDVSCFRARV
jgi:23S rRNA (guanine745-N1)-methyltransferase